MDQYIIPLNIPAYIGAMIGHIPKQFIVPIGARVRLNADQGSITLLEKIFRTS
jgi:muramoyltetrapeptide carboxypeptidase